MTTGCTSDPNTFRCYPFTTYNTSKTASSTTFFWTIAQVTGWSYVISAAPNPFVPQFTNITLTLLDGNMDTERMTFSFPMTAAVIPSAPLDASNTAATCYFTRTTMSATIWTRKRAEYPVNLTTNVSNGEEGSRSSDSFENWPYAVEIAQVSSTRDGPPDCKDSNGNKVGNVTLPGSRGGQCSCDYSNFGLGA